MDSTSQPRANASQISAWVTRRGPTGRLLVAEAQQDVEATCPKDAAKALDKGLTVLAIEDMKEAAVEDSVELLARKFQLTRVAHLEACA